MKQEVPIWLEQEYQEIDELIESLRISKELLISFRSSPVDILTRTVSDLLIKLRKAYYEETPMTDVPNPVVFFDERFSDPLGNVSQREFQRNPLSAYNPPLEQFLFHLAVFFSRSLKPSFQFQKDFHDLLNKMTQFLPPGLRGQQSKHAEKSNKNIKQIRAEKARSAYYRRRRQFK